MLRRATEIASFPIGSCTLQRINFPAIWRFPVRESSGINFLATDSIVMIDLRVTRESLPKMSMRFLELIVMEGFRAALQIQQDTIKGEKWTTSNSLSIL